MSRTHRTSAPHPHLILPFCHLTSASYPSPSTLPSALPLLACYTLYLMLTPFPQLFPSLDAFLAEYGTLTDAAQAIAYDSSTVH